MSLFFAVLTTLASGETRVLSAIYSVPQTPSPVAADAIPMVPNGEIANAGWALARLNDAADTAAVDYVYPETATPVRLYLIDTAVSNPNSWFDGNSNLTISAVTPIRAPGDNPASTDFDHGTRMLSIIAGPETGGAQGTPIEVINYDIYPSNLGGATNSGLLISAINSARSHFELNPGTPSVISIASGALISGTSFGLENAVLDAVDAGLPVIIAAGNLGSPAADYIPSSYGGEAGVICVGATNQGNTRLALSNYGPEVDFFAPGDDVKTLKLAAPATGQFDLVDGTSPATALATAAALANLSMHPEYTPAELEEVLKAGAFPGSESIVQLPPTDSDGDGRHDVVESFYGSDPLDPSVQPDSPQLSGATGGEEGVIDVQMAFTVDASRFDILDPYTLSDGTTWKVLRSSNLSDWDEATGVLTVGSTVGNKTQLSFATSSGDEVCYLRIEIIEP